MPTYLVLGLEILTRPLCCKMSESAMPETKSTWVHVMCWHG